MTMAFADEIPKGGGCALLTDGTTQIGGSVYSSIDIDLLDGPIDLRVAARIQLCDEPLKSLRQSTHRSHESLSIPPTPISHGIMTESSSEASGTRRIVAAMIMLFLLAVTFSVGIAALDAWRQGRKFLGATDALLLATAGVAFAMAVEIVAGAVWLAMSLRKRRHEKFIAFISRHGAN